MRFGGIDPGVRGGASYIWTDDNLAIVGYETWAFEQMTESDLVAVVKRIGGVSGPDAPELRPVVLVEKQGTRPTDARKNVATLHHQWGMIRGMLHALHVPFEDIPPAFWQKTFKLLMPKGTSRTVKKNKHKATAQRLFPEQKVTLATCDALLIAEHARRQYLKGVACG
jgi:hypothetical protein